LFLAGHPASCHDSAGVAMIEAGELSVDVGIPVIDDDLAEANESFSLFLTVDPIPPELSPIGCGSRGASPPRASLFRPRKPRRKPPIRARAAHTP
jgi:hypothetical protein